MNSLLILSCVSLALVLVNGSTEWNISEEENKDVEDVPCLDEYFWLDCFVWPRASPRKPTPKHKKRITTKLPRTTTEYITEDSVTEYTPSISTEEVTYENTDSTSLEESTGPWYWTPEEVTEESQENNGEVTEEINGGETEENDGEPTEEEKIENDEFSAECLASGSIHDKQDLINIIDYISSFELQIIEKINQSYFDRAMALRQDHEQKLNSFLVLFETKSEHLEHNLNDVMKIREEHQQKKYKFNKDMEQYPQLENMYNNTHKAVEKLKNEFNFVKSMCIEYCGVADISPYLRHKKLLRQFITNEDYYCSPIKDVFTKVKTDMEIFINNISEEMSKKLDEEDETYKRMLEDLKQKIENMALKEFGADTMSQILTLFDKYHHIEINQYEVSDMLFKIKNELTKVDLVVSVAQQDVKKLKKQCFSCPGVLLRSFNKKMLLLEERSKSLLEKLIEEKQDQIKLSVNEAYTDIFNELNQKFSISEEEFRFLIEKLRPIQYIVKEEMAKLEDLSLDKIKTSFDEVIALDKKLQDLGYHEVSRLTNQISFLISQVPTTSL